MGKWINIQEGQIENPDQKIKEKVWSILNGTIDFIKEVKMFRIAKALFDLLMRAVVEMERKW